MRRRGARGATEARPDRSTDRATRLTSALTRITFGAISETASRDSHARSWVRRRSEQLGVTSFSSSSGASRPRFGIRALWFGANASPRAFRANRVSLGRS